MPGFITVAKFSLAEIVRGRVFKTIMIIALIVNFLVCFMGYWTVSRSPLSGEIIKEQKRELSHMDGIGGIPSDISELTDPMVLSYITTFLKWFAYSVYIFFGNMLVIFIAIGIMAPELERRSIYTLISKPLSRTGIISGKLLGVMICLLIYALIMILSAQFFFLIVGAKFQPSIFPAFAIGFINFLIFGALAMFLAVNFRPIPSAVVSMMILWVSTFAGTFTIKTIGQEIFKFGKWVDYVLLILPQQKNIGFYALSFIFDKYQKSMIAEAPDMLKFISDSPRELIQPLIWLGCILVINFLSFYKKEFD
ncbi:MAG: ABC transporter permease subunit [bacterium]